LKGAALLPIGIDLGTTYSVVACVTPEGSIQILDNDDGQQLTASAVHFGDRGQVMVGRVAKEMSQLEPDRVVTGIKRHMGKEHVLAFGGTTFRPEGISAVILRRLAQNAADFLKIDVDQLVAVITVPAYFGVAEHEATAAAATIAELTCIDLVAEPVAAALFYGVSSGDTGTVLVYDLGGGTFDATIVRLTETGPIVVAVDGSNELGGLNFDERLQDLLVERYVLATSDESARDDEEFLLQVGHQAEELKKALSRAISGSVQIQRAGSKARISITRDEFEKATSDLITESLIVVDRVIASAEKLGAPRPRRVLLVGGATRMGMVKAALEKHLNIAVRLNEPDLAVAKGAAIHAMSLTGADSQRCNLAVASSGGAHRLAASKPVRSVTARALGIKLFDSHDASGQRIFVQHLIQANTPLPIEAVHTRVSTILAGQDRARIELMEQSGAVASSALEHNRRVLDGELVGLPADLGPGEPIDITLSVGLDGRIRCCAMEPKSGRQLVLESYMEGVSDNEELAEQQVVVSGLKFAR
jgi:molecular chaperone DnaK